MNSFRFFLKILRMLYLTEESNSYLEKLSTNLYFVSIISSAMLSFGPFGWGSNFTHRMYINLVFKSWMLNHVLINERAFLFCHRHVLEWCREFCTTIHYYIWQVAKFYITFTYLNFVPKTVPTSYIKLYINIHIYIYSVSNYIIIESFSNLIAERCGY